MNEFVFTLVNLPRQFAKVVPASIDLERRSTVIQLIASPIDCLQRHGVEAIGIKEGGLVMVA